MILICTATIDPKGRVTGSLEVSLFIILPWHIYNVFWLSSSQSQLTGALLTFGIIPLMGLLINMALLISEHYIQYCHMDAVRFIQLGHSYL